MAKNLNQRISLSGVNMLKDYNNDLRGISLGVSYDDVLREARDILLSDNANYRRLLDTELTRVTNTAALDAQAAQGIREYQILPIRDDRLCDFCASMADNIYDMDAMLEGITAPPFHPHCRCCTIPFKRDKFTYQDELLPPDNYFQAQSAEEARKWIKENATQDYEDMDNYLLAYKGTKSAVYNSYADKIAKGGTLMAVNKEARTAIRAIDRNMKKVGQDIIVWKGVKGNTLKTFENAKVGESVIVNNYLSTSLDKDIANKFTLKTNQVILKIYVADSTFAYVYNQKNILESEILLARRRKYKILKKEVLAGQTIITIEVF